MKLKQVLPLLMAILLLVSLGLSINSFASSYEYYTLSQTSFSFDNSASIYYEYGTSASNTVVVNQALNSSLNAVANYSTSADYWHNVAIQFRDELGFSGLTRLRTYRLAPSLLGVDSISKIRVSQNLDLNYFYNQFRDLLGDNTVSAITLSFRFASFYSGTDDLSTITDYGKLNMFGYNLVPSSFDLFTLYPNSSDPDLPSPNGYGLDAYYNVNVLVDSLSDLFTSVIPFYYEMAGLQVGYPSQASIASGFVFSDFQLGIGFDRSVQELIDVNQNLIDLRGDISDLNDSMQDVKDAIDMMNNPNDPNYTSPSEIGDFGDAVDVMESAHRGGRSMIDDSIGTVQLSLPGLTSAYLQINRLYTLLINTPIGTILAFACSFGLCLFFIGSLKSKY